MFIIKSLGLGLLIAAILAVLLNQYPLMPTTTALAIICGLLSFGCLVTCVVRKDYPWNWLR